MARAPKCRLGRYRRSETWDEGVDWEQARKCLLRLLKWSLKEKPKLYPYFAILYIQLLNGCRAREAIRVYKLFLESAGRRREYYLSALKRGVTRLYAVPVEVRFRETDMWILGLDDVKLRERVYWAARTYLGTKTHSLRSATITYMSEHGVPPQSIAKALGYKQMNTIIRYIQTKKGEDLIRELTGLK